MRIAILAAMLSGCAAPGYKAADCDRFRFGGYNVLACDDDSVGRHCKRDAPFTDSGKPVTYHPRACFAPGKGGRKANIYIGKSYLRCLPHEIAHFENPGRNAWVEAKYPCVGDKRP